VGLSPQRQTFRWHQGRLRVADIVRALKEINLAAAETFGELYLGKLIKNEDEA
jgi:hypothetical protein